MGVAGARGTAPAPPQRQSSGVARSRRSRAGADATSRAIIASTKAGRRPGVAPVGADLSRPAPPWRPARVASASPNFRRHAKSDEAARPRSMQNRRTDNPLRSCAATSPHQFAHARSDLLMPRMVAPTPTQTTRGSRTTQNRCRFPATPTYAIGSGRRAPESDLNLGVDDIHPNRVYDAPVVSLGRTEVRRDRSSPNAEHHVSTHLLFLPWIGP